MLSFDALNITTTLLCPQRLEWRTSGAGDPECKLVILMALTPNESRPARQHHTMALVTLHHKGIIILRPLTVFDHDDVPHDHMEILFEEV